MGMVAKGMNRTSSISFTAFILLLVGLTAIGCQRSHQTGQDTRLYRSTSSLFGELRSSENNELLNGAFVRLYDQGRIIARDSIVTDQTGQFIFANLHPGFYRLQAARIAHRRLTREFLIRAAVTDTLRLIMVFDTTGLIADCMSPDGRSFGQQFCRH